MNSLWGETKNLSFVTYVYNCIVESAMKTPQKKANRPGDSMLNVQCQSSSASGKDCSINYVT